MHPDTRFHSDDRALCEALIAQVGFVAVFAATPDGPRVAHTPLLSDGAGAVQFHLARGNALTRHLAGTTALAVVNGPDGYVSPRWYSDPGQVPTWNYVALELEGPVRAIDPAGLRTLLERLSAHHEGTIAEGEPWTLDKMPADKLAKLMDAIVGFEMEVRAWRPTLKLSQNKPAAERDRVAAGLEAQGARAIAALMRDLPK